MPSIDFPHIDGEKIPDEVLPDIFRPPPGVPSSFLRSALVTGSRGSGKTTLFRYQKAMHTGLALHISLATELASLTKQTGYGPLAFNIPLSLEPLLAGKSASLLAISFADRLVKKGIPVPTGELLDCLPQEAVVVQEEINEEWVRQTKKKIARARLEAFEGISESSPLPQLASALGKLVARANGPLLLLLDRADMVPTPALGPVFELLDQSDCYVVLVAMRPGPVGRLAGRATESVVAGDHYGIVHLGTHPRSQEWVRFVADAVQAQLGDDFSVIPDEAKALIQAISRDSLRTALELSARSVPRGDRGDHLAAALDDLKENQLAAAQRTLQRYHPDFRRLIGDLRKEAEKQHGGVVGPLNVSLKYAGPDTLFGGPTQLEQFIDIGLRGAALCLPEGHRWAPGFRASEVEVPPIFLWQKGEAFWTIDSFTPMRIERAEREIFRVAGGPPRTQTIFVAFRMKSPESQKFRDEFEEAIKAHPDLSQLGVKDGRVPAGGNWPEVIRKRLRAARVVVGDVEGLRLDVVFELGFAFGLNKVIIPVTSRPEGFAKLPQWLAATQFGYYYDHTGMMQLLASVSAHLTDPEFAKPKRNPQPVPALAVWIRDLPSFRVGREQFLTLAAREGLKTESYPDDYPVDTLIRRAVSAALLIVTVDGTALDGLMHFVCGAVAARPEAGFGRKIKRVVLVLAETREKAESFTADSLRRCSDTVRIVGLEELRVEVTRFCEIYHQWVGQSGKQAT